MRYRSQGPNVSAGGFSADPQSREVLRARRPTRPRRARPEDQPPQRRRLRHAADGEAEAQQSTTTCPSAGCSPPTGTWPSAAPAAPARNCWPILETRLALGRGRYRGYLAPRSTPPASTSATATSPSTGPQGRHPQLPREAGPVHRRAHEVAPDATPIVAAAEGVRADGRPARLPVVEPGKGLTGDPAVGDATNPCAFPIDKLDRSRTLPTTLAGMYTSRPRAFGLTRDWLACCSCSLPRTRRCVKSGYHRVRITNERHRRHHDQLVATSGDLRRRGDPLRRRPPSRPHHRASSLSVGNPRGCASGAASSIVTVDVCSPS